MKDREIQKLGLIYEKVLKENDEEGSWYNEDTDEWDVPADKLWDNETKSQVMEILQNHGIVNLDPKYLDVIHPNTRKFLSAEAHQGSMDDTSPRETVIGAFAKGLIGMRWPSYSEGPIVSRKFFNTLAKKLRSIGAQYKG